MDFHSLQYAFMVFQTGSISLAAKLLYTSQPNVSNVIKRLESDLHFPLFIRTSSGVTPTAEGRQFFQDISPLIEQFSKLEQDYSTPKTIANAYSVSATDSDIFSHCFLTSLSQCPPQASEGEHRFWESSFAAVMQDTKEKKCNTGFLYFPHFLSRNVEKLMEYDGLEYRYIGRDSAFIITHQGNPFLPPPGQESFCWIQNCILLDYNSNLFHPKLSFHTREIPWLKDFSFPKTVNVGERASKYVFLERLSGSIAFSCRLSQDTLERYHLTQLPCPALPQFEFGYVTLPQCSPSPFCQDMIHQVQVFLSQPQAQ